MQAITTLPMNPQDSLSIGRCYTPVLALYLAHMTNKELLLSFNVSGRRSQFSSLDAYMERCLSPLGSVPSLWKDDDPTFLQDELPHFLQIFTDMKMLSSRREIIYKCSCGAVEVTAPYLDEVRTRHRVMVDDRCRSCNSKVSPQENLSLHITPRPLNHHLQLPQGYVRKEFLQHCHSITRLRSERISRCRPENPCIVFDGEVFYLDIDFVWGLYLSSLAMRGFSISTLVCSSHVIYQAAHVYLLNSPILQALGHEQPFDELIVHPYVHCSSTLGDVADFHFISTAIALLRAWSFDRKETTLDSRLIYLTDLAISSNRDLLAITSSASPRLDSIAALALLRDIPTLLKRLRCGEIHKALGSFLSLCLNA